MSVGAGVTPVSVRMRFDPWTDRLDAIFFLMQEKFDYVFFLIITLLQVCIVKDSQNIAIFSIFVSTLCDVKKKNVKVLTCNDINASSAVRSHRLARAIFITSRVFFLKLEHRDL